MSLRIWLTVLAAGVRFKKVIVFYKGSKNERFDEFTWRGLVYDSTEGLKEAFETEKITAYIGFDHPPPACIAVLCCLSWDWYVYNSSVTLPSPWPAAVPV